MIGPDQSVRRTVTVNPRLSTFAAQTAWDQGTVWLSLTSPSGKVYDRLTTDPAAHHHIQVNAESFAIDKPEAGQWSLVLTGATVQGSGVSVRVYLTQVPLSDFGPIAYVGASTDRGVAPLAIQFTGGASAFTDATIASYRWDFGDCSPGTTEPNVTHVFTFAGSFTVTLTVADSNGEVDSATRDIFVTAFDHPPTAGFLWGSIDATRPNQVLVNAQPSNDVDGPITGYSWDFGDGTTGMGELVSHDYAKAGTYPVKLTVTDDGGLTASTCEMVTPGQPLGASVACPG